VASTSSKTLAHFEGSPYEEIRDFGGSDITPIGGAIVTDLDGILPTDTTSTDLAKSVEFLAVSSHYCAECYFYSSTATGYPRTTRKQK